LDIEDIGGEDGDEPILTIDPNFIRLNDHIIQGFG